MPIANVFVLIALENMKKKPKDYYVVLILMVLMFPIISVNCEWGEWVTEGMCSATCGEGTYSKGRYKSVIEKNGGTCTGNDSVTETCNLKGCPGRLN